MVTHLPLKGNTVSHRHSFWVLYLCTARPPLLQNHLLHIWHCTDPFCSLTGFSLSLLHLVLSLSLLNNLHPDSLTVGWLPKSTSMEWPEKEMERPYQERFEDHRSEGANRNLYPPWNSGGISWSYLYQIFNSHVLFPCAPVVRRTLQRKLRNSSSLQLQRPPVHTNAHHYILVLPTIMLLLYGTIYLQMCRSVSQ